MYIWSKINEITEVVRNMGETTPYRKVLLQVGTNNILEGDQQTILKKIKILAELIQKKWPAEVIYSGIILHKNDIRKNIKINKVNDKIRQNSDEWTIQFLNSTNVVTLPTGHTDPEAYFDNLHLNNEKGTKEKLANNIKFALGLKTKAFFEKRNHQSHVEQTESNAKTPPFDRAHTAPITVETYAKKVKGNSSQDQVSTPIQQPQATYELPTAADLSNFRHALKTLQPLMILLQHQQ